MNKVDQDIKQFLEDQVKWSEEQIRILDEMDQKLHKMKGIAEYALEHELTPLEINKLNAQLEELKNEFSFLEKRLYPVVH